ncbi:MAG: hypothetical protein KIS85_01270 [Anaerolineales bacterium]|nr:hypothetical protein [Anaerolineales bacterium]
MKTAALLLSLALLLSACAPAGPSQAEVQGSAQALAAGWLETQAALPTETTAPSDTPQPSPTVVVPSETPTETATLSPTPAFTATPFGYMNPSDFATAQADKNDGNAPLVLNNQTSEEVRLVILSPVQREFTFTKSFTVIIPVDAYTYRAWIGKTGPLNGSFRITNGDKHQLIFHNDRINFSEP